MSIPDYLLLSGSLVIMGYLGFYLPFKWDAIDMETHELKKSKWGERAYIEGAHSPSPDAFDASRQGGFPDNTSTH